MTIAYLIDTVAVPKLQTLQALEFAFEDSDFKFGSSF